MKIVSLPAEVEREPREARLAPLETHDAYAALFEIGAQIQAQEVNLTAVLELITEKAAELVNADVGWLALVDPETKRVRVTATTGVRHEPFKHMSVEIGEGLGGKALAQGETLVVLDYSSYLQDTPPSVRAAVTEEGVVSVICAPMVREERMVGALYVGDRRARAFAGAHAALVTALASQASIAIENSRLLEQLASKNRTLEQSAAIHRRLTDSALQQTGIEGVASTLAELLGRSVVVEQEVAAPFQLSVGDSDGGNQPIAARAPISAGEDELGRVLVLGETALDDLGQRALEHGTTVLAVELLKRRASQEIEWRLGGELLEELLAQSGPVDRRLAARARRFGMDLRQRHRIVVLEAVDGEIDESAVRLAAARTHTPGQRPVMLATLGSERGLIAIPEALDGEVTELVDALGHAASGDAESTVSAGVSRLTHDMPAALREGLACAKFAGLSGQPGATVRADDLGAMRFLFALEDPAPIHAYVDEQLGPLFRFARERDSPLLETLRAYLEADGHHGTIAERCHIHKSTVKYRIARIAEGLDRRLGDPQVRFELRLAVALVDVLAALGLAQGLEERGRVD